MEAFNALTLTVLNANAPSSSNTNWFELNTGGTTYESTFRTSTRTNVFALTGTPSAAVDVSISGLGLCYGEDYLYTSPTLTLAENISINTCVEVEELASFPTLNFDFNTANATPINDNVTLLPLDFNGDL